MLKSVDSISNLIRAVVSLVVVGALSVAGWFGYNNYYGREHELKAANAQVVALKKDLETKQKEIERLSTSLRLLKVDKRVAQIDVLDQVQGTPGNPSRMRTTFTFAELDDSGKPLEKPKKFTIEGDTLHVDAWVARFDDEFVEQGDPLRGSSIFVFRGLYGDFQRPVDMFELDPEGSRPAGYSQGRTMSDFERGIWENFWEITRDSAKQKQLGIRSADGQGPYVQLEKGKRYRVLLRASDGLTIKLVGDADAPVATGAL